MTGRFLENTFLVDTRDTDLFRQCRPSALLGHLQEAATAAANDLNASRESMMERYNVFWMLARIWYRLDRPLYAAEELRVRTWHRGGRGAALYRDFDLFSGQTRVGEAVSLWVLADLETRKLMRLSEVEGFETTTGGALCKSIQLKSLRMPEEMSLSQTRRLQYSETDINGHINNTKYADFACDALELERIGRGTFVSSMQLGYLAECVPGEILAIKTAREGAQWYVRGADGAGAARFDASLQLRPLSY